MSQPSPDSVIFWVETRLREALNDPEKINGALYVLKVAVEAGDSPFDAMKAALGCFVFDAFGIDPPK